ncbi:ATP-binding protein [Deinococcus peraridilitoris]|uniref:histidine kinase n=1 Tax=Deinococcus peraridilitoris (strain DSM 19664 / LMG 22246 / CIP 109416 / KR-200) TaxID=937777 RepID=K9ZWB7_DEIPD|nr:ATP-binding protein [Deinococcus peraridilitoris]AFZ65871.1 bacteriophytochrome (light-regulated signal transduction histidine kinase) [Deinococcus peraridilitoris DSM 19664]
MSVQPEFLLPSTARRLFDCLPEPFALLDPAQGVLYANPAWARLPARAVRSGADLIGFDLAQDTSPPLMQLVRQVARQGDGATLTAEVTCDETWYQAFLFVHEQCVGLRLLDITAHKMLSERVTVLAQQHQDLQTEADALQAFSAFIEAAGSEADLRVLAAAAVQVVHTALRETDAGYFELHDGTWHATTLSDQIPPPLRVLLTTGLPANSPLAALVTRSATPLLLEHWRALDDAVAQATPLYEAVALAPIQIQGTLHGLLAIGHRTQQRWDTRSRSILQAVWRSLGLVAERANTAQRLLRKREALEAANAELEAFAHSVSHDLRAPVRHVQGFASLAKHALEQQNYEGAQRYLGVIAESSRRMNLLIDDLLQFSKFAEQPLRQQEVQLAALVEEVRGMIEPEVGQRCVRWQIGELPTVWADPSLLRQVLLNLLSNAVKYTGQREQAIIDVSAESRPGEQVVHVRDNGAGFDPKYQGRLFGVFQRLHRQEEFEGTGVGLATVKRIIHRHTGRVWAEGRPGEGATFSFALPERRT